MNTNNIEKLIGKNHKDEIAQILKENKELNNLSLKNPFVTLVLSIFLGMFGIDRLYQGGLKLFLCKLGMVFLTLGTWWLVDIGYSIPMTQEENYKKIIAAA